MSRVISLQKFYAIPRNRLYLFLAKLYFVSNSQVHVEAQYIFESEDKKSFEVVLNFYLKNDWSNMLPINEAVKELDRVVEEISKEMKRPIDSGTL